MNGPTRERGGASGAAVGAPSPTVDVLAAQVRTGLNVWSGATTDDALKALAALVARVTAAAEKEAYAWSCAEDCKGWATRAEEKLRDTHAALADARNALEAWRAKSDREPLEVDISDYSDEFCEGFLYGQSHILDLALARLDGSSDE